MAREETLPPPPASLTTSTTVWGAQNLNQAPRAGDLQTFKKAGVAAETQSQPQAQVQQDMPQAPFLGQQPASLSEAFKTIKPADFLNIYQVPCARQGFLTGIGGGAVIGMLRYILGSNIPKAANWAVGAFALGGIASFEICQVARRAERAKMMRVVEVYDRKQAELRQREAEKKQRTLREEQEREEREIMQKAKRWWKVW